MATEPSTVDANAALLVARRSRRTALIVPREHGAWGLLLVPMLTGAAVALRHGGNVTDFVLLLVAALALFWLRTPLESVLGTSAMRAQDGEERRLVLWASALLSCISIVTLGTLLWGGRNGALWLIGAAAFVAFAAQAVLKKLGRKTRMLSEMVGTIGLTASAPAAYYVITGKLGMVAGMLWLANFLFAGNQIHYVQLRIHTAKISGVREKFARGWKFAAGQLGMIAAVAAACFIGWMPWAVVLAFAPVTLRGYFYFLEPPRPLIVRKLGWSELRQAAVFCALVSFAFWIA